MNATQNSPAEIALTLLTNARASCSLALDPRVGPMRASMVAKAGELLAEEGMDAWACDAANLAAAMVDTLTLAQTDTEAAFYKNSDNADMLIRLHAQVELG